MRLACSLGPAWALRVSCASSHRATVAARRGAPEGTCAWFNLTFMALVNSLKRPKRVRTISRANPLPECLTRLTSRIDDSSGPQGFAEIIALRTARAVTAGRRPYAYLVARARGAMRTP